MYVQTLSVASMSFLWCLAHSGYSTRSANDLGFTASCTHTGQLASSYIWRKLPVTSDCCYFFLWKRKVWWLKALRKESLRTLNSGLALFNHKIYLAKTFFFSFYTQIDEIQDYFWKNLIGSIYGMISWTQEQTVLHIPRYTNEAKMKIKPLEFVSVRWQACWFSVNAPLLFSGEQVTREAAHDRGVELSPSLSGSLGPCLWKGVARLLIQV